MSDNTLSLLSKIITVLWVIWGLVHMFAGVVVMGSDAAGGVQAIADGTDPATLVVDYPAAAGAILNQHGWNLLWAGAVTLVGGVLIWRGSLTALWVSALVGGLFDLGYFMFMDLGGFVNFFPGTVMTLVSGTAIVLSVFVWRGRNTAA